MSYNYLFDLYEKIDLHLEEARESIERPHSDRNNKSYQQGRLDLLTDFRQFLADNMNQKLPRRMQKKMMS